MALTTGGVEFSSTLMLLGVAGVPWLGVAGVPWLGVSISDTVELETYQTYGHG